MMEKSRAQREAREAAMEGGIVRQVLAADTSQFSCPLSFASFRFSLACLTRVAFPPPSLPRKPLPPFSPELGYFLRVAQLSLYQFSFLCFCFVIYLGLHFSRFLIYIYFTCPSLIF